MFRKLVLVSSLVLSINAHSGPTEHFEAALATVNLPQGEQLEAMINGLVTNQIRMTPSMRPIRPAMEKFYREIFQSNEFTHTLAELNMEFFTHEELIELKALMDQPIFEKWQQVMPEYMTQMMQASQKIVMENQGRLHELITQEYKRVEELQKLDKDMGLTTQSQ